MRRKKSEFDARRAAAREESPPGEEIDFEAAFLRAGGSTEHVIAQDVMRTLAEIGYTGGVHVELSRHSHIAPAVARESIEFLRPFRVPPN